MARPREYEDRYHDVMHLLSLGRTVREIGHALQMGKSTVHRMKTRGCELLSLAGDMAVAIVAEDRDVAVKSKEPWSVPKEKMSPQPPSMSHTVMLSVSHFEAEQAIPEIDFPMVD